MREHIVVRVKSDGGKTIHEHLKIFEQRGKVVFGKIGAPISPKLLNSLNQQLQKSILTYFFIAIYEGKNKPFTYLQAEMLSVNSTLNPHLRQFVPAYIDKISKQIKIWFEISDIRLVPPPEVKKICLITNGKEISSSVRGTTSTFRVGLKGDLELKTLPCYNSSRYFIKDNNESDVDLTLDIIDDDDQEFINDFLSSKQ